MRLLNTSTARFRHFDHPYQTRYAILSHTWDHTDGEQSLQDILVIRGYTEQAHDPTFKTDEACPPALTILSSKVRDCCVFARMNGYHYVWVDTCCIDKSSSAELSEAINSMYEWYSRAAVCYAFLEDVDDHENPRSPESSFRKSRWFTRGWTLQELIAPALVIFLSRNWRILGTKDTLADVIEEITGIERGVLTHNRSLDSVSVARRMSWAARRKTTRTEDEAYSLMGIFGVHMPTIYGEGRKAFIRLQREILEHCADQTIFAWGHIFPDHTMVSSGFQVYTGLHDPWEPTQPPSNDPCLLAASPASFAECEDIVPIPLGLFSQRIRLPVAPCHYTVTSYGVHVRFPILVNSGTSMFILAVLACQDGAGSLVALMLHAKDGTNQHYVGNRLLIDREDSPSPGPEEEEGEVREGNVSYGTQYEGLFYRCTTILPETMDLRLPFPRSLPGVSMHHISNFVMGEFYIPSHRHLTVDDTDVDLADSMQEVGAAIPRIFSFAGPCVITFPSWLHTQLEESGYRLSISKPRFSDRHVPRNPIRLDWDGSWYRVIKLNNNIDVAAQVHLFLCPHDTSDCPPIHATIVFRENLTAFHRSGFRRVPPCDVEHIDNWLHGSMPFLDASGSVVVQLTFSRVTLGRSGIGSAASTSNRTAEYSLLIDVGVVGLPTAVGRPSQARGILLEREWTWKGNAYWEDDPEDLSDSSEGLSDEEDGARMVEEHPISFVSVKFADRSKA